MGALIPYLQNMAFSLAQFVSVCIFLSKLCREINTYHQEELNKDLTKYLSSSTTTENNSLPHIELK